MSDNMELSLDEYIKMKKIGRGGKIRGGRGGQGNATRGKKVIRGGQTGRGRGGARGLRVRAGGRGRGTSGRDGLSRRNARVYQQSGRGTPKGGRGGLQGRKINPRVLPPKLQAQMRVGVSPNFARVPTRGRFQSRQQNLKSRFMGEGFRELPRTRKRNARARLGFGTTTPLRASARFLVQDQPGIQFLVRKSVKRAKKVLANRGIRPSQEGFDVTQSGFGLVSSSMQENIRRQRELIKQNINRSQAARIGMMGSGMRSRNDFEAESPFFKSRQPSKGRGRAPRIDSGVWASTVRTVRNTNLDLNTVQPQPTSSSGSSLNPEIQRRIMILQQQGRRNRGEGTLDVNLSNDIRGAVVTSSIPLSDRFRMFMN